MLGLLRKRASGRGPLTSPGNASRGHAGTVPAHEGAIR
jgi:hypothetical protein